MVDVNAEVLAGVATTVFLALIFFGVIVLWDVALALRSVGDKIDKLEDNLDDDLKDIGYALDAISKSSGPGSGTQLHLNSGTISPGPAQESPKQPPQETRQTQQQEATSHPNGQHQPEYAQREDEGGERAQDPPHDERREVDRQREDRHEPESEPESDPSVREGDSRLDAEDEAADGLTDETRDEDESAQTDEEDDRVSSELESDEDEDESTTDHPRASINRGRFVTSPDRTPWYATPLDREVIANAGPTIAGELEAWPDEDDEPVIIGEPADDRSETVDDADAADEEEADEPIAAPPVGAASAETSPGGARVDPDAVGEETDREEADATDEVLEFESPGSDHDVPQAGSEGSDESSSDDDANAEDDRIETGDGASSGGDAESTSEGDEDDLEVVAEPADDALETTPSDAADGDETSNRDDEDRSISEGVDGDTEAFEQFDLAGLPGDEDDDDVPEQTVDEALESVNEDTPSLSLSSHSFDVIADADDDGAVLRFDFDPDSIAIEGSTKRLLRYQMRSFADRESTPDADVTIGVDTVTIELPDADGAAISRWGQAAVSIIDRTLYLSDDG